MREQIAAATSALRAHGGRRSDVKLLAAIKYVAADDLPLLAEAGIGWWARTARRSWRRKHAAHGELFEWDFIGQLQSRRVRAIVRTCA